MRWPLLDVLPAPEREALLRAVRRRRYARGEVVFHEGDPAEGFHLVETGRFAARVSTPAGSAVILSLLRPPDAFGEVALLRREPPLERSATITALEPATTLVLSTGAFRVLRDRHPAVEELLAEVLAQRVDALSRRLIESLHLSVDQRVHLRLGELAEAYADGPGPVVVPLSQDLIAEFAGATRPTVNQALQKLVADGVVELGRGRVVLKDRQRLAALVGRR